MTLSYKPAGRLLCAITACVLSFTGNAAMAQSRETMVALRGAEMSGGMTAAAKICGDYSEADLAARKQEHKRQAMSEGGLSDAQYEAAYKQGYDSVYASLAGTATSAQRQQSCEQLRALSQMGL